MQLELIKRGSTSHQGYGAGSGEVIREEYKCPCGNGIVIYEKDDIPGFKDSSTFCGCEECKGKYHFRRDNAEEKN